MKKITTIIAAIMVSFSLAFGQELTSKGRVADIDGNPLAGVNVNFKAKTGNIGTITDANGLFTIAGLPEKGGVLNFQKDGYAYYKQKVSTPNVIYITLSEDENGVNSERAVGYGNNSKSSNTGSSAGISSKEMKGEVYGRNTMQGLVGRVPGLTSDYKIRGSNNYPLFVINGVISSKSVAESLNGADIDRVEVLKDAASTAIYGSRGGDGVILITTKGYGKSNKVNDKPKKVKE